MEKNMRYFKAISAAAFIFLFAVAIGLAAIASGSRVAGTLTTTVDSGSAYVGQPVQLSRVTSEDGTISGAHMYGTVTSVTKAGQGRPGRVSMTFTRLVLANGTTYAVNGLVE